MQPSITDETRRLQLAVNELRILNDIATTISSIQPVKKIIDQIVFKCIKHLGVEEGTVSLLEIDTPEKEFHTMVRHYDSSVEKVPIKLDDHLKGWMLKKQSILLSNDIQEDERFNFLQKTSFSFRSILCAPLMIKGDLIGYLAVFNKKDGEPFSDEDRRLISIIASQSAQVIENARLYEEEKAFLSLQEEMRMARDIQLHLLPNSTPEIEGFQISTANIPAKAVGGDYLDFISLPNSKLGFCVGDITGKGMPAAMLMANLQATLRSHAIMYKDCIKCLHGTNNLLCRSTEPTKFATLFYGILDHKNATIQYSNGGHDAPLLIRNNEEPVHLDSTGLLLGVMEESQYEMRTISLQPSDLLLIYSDGITEAMNHQKEEYGIDRLKAQAAKNSRYSSEELLAAILQDVKDHADGAPQSDDITLMIIQRI
ncbi:GAF domain-containing SpoIIE family protein phosphatase [Fodinibius sp. SL11]|uniref:GAF domain-containing SpoIIE family protein phosphatase n=1 Tax=Fodinibius sp. SL11 TaxID=3425690 RepID=UPI003F881BE5